MSPRQQSILATQKDKTHRRQCKMSSSKKLIYKGALRQVFICLKCPPFLDFCLGWSSNFVGSESGQIQSGKLLENMVSRTTQHQPPLHKYTVYLFTQGRGRGRVEPERRERGNREEYISQDWVENINMTE
jgi:hypothetical protein